MKTNLSTLKIAAAAVGIFISTFASAQFTAVASGDWSSSATWGGTVPPSTVTAQNITIPSGITVNLDGDVTFTGLLNTFLVNGVLTNTNTANTVFMTSGNLAGTGTVSVNKIKFSALGSTSYAGTLNLKTMVNTVTTLAFASMANITDTLELESGNLSLNTNGNLTMMSGSTVKVGNGSLVINSGIFTSGNAYNVMYVGTSKTTGVELNSVTMQNLYLNLSSNAETVTLANNTMVNGNLKMTTGKLKINGKKITLKGDVMVTAGSMIDSDASSDISIEGTGTTTDALMFTSTSSVHELTINRTTGMVKLGSSALVSTKLNLMEGSFSIENGGTLNMSSGSTIHVEKGTLSLNSGSFVATSAYGVEYAGTADATSGVELSGTGLAHLTVNYTSSSSKVMLNNNTALSGGLNLTNGKLDLNGKNLTLNGTFMQSTTAWIIANTSSELALNLTSVTQNTLYFDNASAASQTLGKLKINTQGANSVVLGSKLIISNELSFLQGKLELGNGDLEIMPSASITGYDDAKYVITSDNASGVLIQNVASGGAYVTFPVGLSSNYSPAYVQQTATGTSGNFSAKCHTLTGSATLKAVNRTWMVEGMGITTVDANLKFGWKAAAEVNAFDRTNAYVSHYTSGAWDVTAAASATAGVNTTFELSRTGLTSLSPFAVVENGQPVGIKEIAKITGVELYPNPSKDVINIKVLNTSDEYQYELIDFTGRTVLSTSNANSVNKFDVANLSAGCYFVKITNLADNKTTTKRFVKQ